MTDQSEHDAHTGDQTVPLVPDGGYAQPEVPPLEDTSWPDFSYDEPADSTYGAEPTVAYTQPISYANPAASAPAVTAPLPSVNPTPQPAAPAPYTNPQPVYAEPPAPAARYETYQPFAPYEPPAPVPYTYPAPVMSLPDHPNAVTSLVLGIAGIVLMPILAPVAWFLASRGRREVARFPGRWASGGSLTAGYVLGIIGTILWGLLLLFVMFIFFVAIAAATF